ncbi:hypothetical protein OL548_20095 [Lysinibacillus sp. MHQ-1]|nr:hypothetical protein OL548_20095 [Lysinibacillus sp. MHQ-1]
MIVWPSLKRKYFFDKEKAYSYLKTRYHVLIPNGDTVDLINPDRLDIGDGEYKSPYEQLIAENKLTDMQHHAILRELALYTHEKQQAINTKSKRKKSRICTLRKRSQSTSVIFY